MPTPTRSVPAAERAGVETRPPEGKRPDAGPRVLVLDVGSSSVRAWFFDRRGRGYDPGPGAQRPVRWRTEPAGAMECDADPLVRRAEEAIDAALAYARVHALEIGAVAIAAFWHSLLGLDAAGRPVTPVYGWGDTRARADALRLLDEVDEPALHRRTGCFLNPSYPLVKLAWLRRTDPDAFAGVDAWVSLPEYLEARLHGRRRCSVSMASGTGLLDVHRLDWDPAALAIAGIAPERLSPLVDADAPVRGLRAGLRTRWPELDAVDWFPALGDGACANAGSGAVGLDRIGVTVGTSAAARALWRPGGEVEIPPALWCYRLDGRRWVAGGALSNGGNGIAYLRGLLALPPEAAWEARVEAMEPDAHGLTVLPFLVEERGPGWHLETRSAIVGLRPSTPPEHLVRAWMEAVAYRVSGLCERIERLLGHEPRVIASGGALHASPVWVQLFADVMGRTVSLPGEPEATARGAALVAMEALGWIPHLVPPEAPAAEFRPDPARHARYREAMDRQRALEAALRPPAPLASPSDAERRDS